MGREERGREGRLKEGRRGEGDVAPPFLKFLDPPLHDIYHTFSRLKISDIFILRN